MTETPLNPKINRFAYPNPIIISCYRENLVQLIFETFNFPHFYLAMQHLLSLYSSGKTTAMVLDLGHGNCITVPIFEGYVIQHGIVKVPVAGEDLTGFLMQQIGVGYNEVIY